MKIYVILDTNKVEDPMTWDVFEDVQFPFGFYDTPKIFYFHCFMC